MCVSLRDFRRHAGQLAIAGFAGHTIPEDLRRLAKAFDLGGVIFFARNVAEPQQVAELSREAQALAQELPLWVSVDQEGGPVARLRKPFTEWPPMITLGRSGDERLAERFARALAAELKAVGISLDYTPVLDVRTNPGNPVIGDRALADRAEDVARLGAAIIRTLQAEGIAACGKHFPGHGDTTTDSHHELPVIDHPPDRFDAVELVPFKAAIAADVAAIMTAHILIPALDEERPATLSAAIERPLRSQRGDGAGHRGRVRCGADVSARPGRAGRRARDADPRRRGRPSPGQARRGGGRAPAARQGTVSRAAPLRAAGGAAPHDSGT
ncbi:MAG: hypothetical protein DMF85_15285 [Acidobacteria bacterium]|nr:MAG: hypothetical protein DMF85_15285 [Acidobacteriota bacterium]